MGTISVTYVMLTTYVALTTAIVRMPNCGIRAGSFTHVSRARLKPSQDADFHSVTDVNRPELCVKKCLGHDPCRSINHNNATKECELLEDMMRIGGSQNRIQDIDTAWVHYEEDVYQRAVGHVCENNPCGDGECKPVCRSPGYACECKFGTMDSAGNCNSPENKCLLIRGQYQDAEGVVAVVSESTPSTPNSFLISVENVTASVKILDNVQGQFAEGSCENGVIGENESLMPFTFSHDYRTCTMKIKSADGEYELIRQGCGYEHCKKLAGNYDKGQIHSSVFGVQGGLKVSRQNRPIYIHKGVMYQVEPAAGMNITTQCLGYIREDIKLVKQPSDCEVVWLFQNVEETWKRTTEACQAVEGSDGGSSGGSSGGSTGGSTLSSTGGIS